MRLHLLVSLFIALAVPVCDAAETVPPDFTLREHLGRAWSNECVRFPVSEAQWQHVRAGHALVDQQGYAVPYQVIAPDADAATNRRVAFLAGLKRFGVSTFRFEDKPGSRETDLTVEEDEHAVRVFNGSVGVALRKRVADGGGPIAGIRLPSGEWVADTRFDGGVAFRE